ncbi:MAG: ATP-binding protein [Bdellovibrionales bacterium]
MNKSISEPNESPLQKLLTKLFGEKKFLQEKARLQAFLAAFPGEYCGFAHDGSVVYSDGFCKILGLDAIKSLSDIQSVLPPSDSAALEGYFNRLEQKGTNFSFVTEKFDHTKHFKFSGSQGRDLDASERFDIVWVEDITEETLDLKNFEKNKRDSEREQKKYQEALASFPFPCWLRDQHQKLIWVNHAYAEALDENEKDIINDQKEIASNTRKSGSSKNKAITGIELAKKAHDSGVEQISEAHIIIGGKRVLMRLRETPIPLAEMTIGMAQDITKLESIGEELKRYQSSNRELLEQLQSAIGIFGADQALEFYNSSFAQLWGLEEGWLNKKPKFGDLMEKLRETRRLPEQANFRRFKQGWLDMFTSLIKPHEEMLYLPDGSALRMLVVPHSMGGLMMTFEDVTSRLELESSYNTLIAVQKETLDNLGEGVAVYGGDGRLKLWNPAFASLWGFNPETLDGEPHISKLIEKKEKYFTKKEWPAKREELISKGLDRIMHEGRLKRADKTLVDFSTVPLPDGGVLITYIDVTDSMRVENALREKNAALEAAEQLKLDFLANVSYQLRTPLNAIMGFNEILDQEYFGELNTRQKQYTHDINQASTRLLGLINDILDLSTLEAGYMSLNNEDVKIYTMVQSIKDLVSDWARKKKIEIKITCAKNIGRITADEKRLKQALINVIRNAINFTPENGEISLTAKRKKEGLEITVIDNGVGIPKEDRSRVFEPFERAQTGPNDKPLARSGAGLGLSLVKNIIALHGGTIDIESENKKGTTVTIFIPLIAQETPLKLPLKKAS